MSACSELCVCRTPLGRPVVPEVYMIIRTSAGSSTGSARVASGCLPCRVGPRRRRRDAVGGRRLRGGARLGEEFLASGALAIEDRTVRRQEDPQNNPLPPLKERTIARKRRLGLDTRILIGRKPV